MMAVLFAVGVSWLTWSYMTEGQPTLVRCPSKLIFHWPCPTCGTTRAFLHLLRGEILTALWQNANVLPAAVFLFGFPVLGLYDLFSGRRSLRRAFDWLGDLFDRRWIVAMALIAEAAIWVHNIYIGN